MTYIRKQLEEGTRYEMMSRAFEGEEGYQSSYLLDIEDKDGEQLYLIIIDVFQDRIVPFVTMDGPEGYTETFELEGVKSLEALENTCLSLWCAVQQGSLSFLT